MRTYPAAYCPPGIIYSMLSIPRALPPVTHSSALQAPECIQVLYDVTTLLTGQMPHMALCCLVGYIIISCLTWRSAAWKAVL